MQQDILMIHGTWGNGTVWDLYKPILEEKGFRVHTPTLKYHDLPFNECGRKVAEVSITEYVDEMVDLVKTMETRPYVFGWSLGGLIAQLTAAKVPTQGVVCLASAPPFGTFAMYPWTIAWIHDHYTQWNFWKRPVMPKWDSFKQCIANCTSDEIAIPFFDACVPESGRVYYEMGFEWINPFGPKTTKVDFGNVHAPVLAISGSEDRCVHKNVAKSIAKRHEDGKYIEIPNQDHLSMGAKPEVVQEIIGYFEEWRKD